MSSAKKALQFFVVVTLLAVGVALESMSPLTFSAPSLDSVQVASRYQLRNRTPNFFSRSKTTPSTPTKTTPAQPTARRG